ncbi:Nicotinamidase-related amidase [Blastococcus sp. DSM 46786]|uniref:cysteine hydrolase family protein n=1 Tax=Blastococcus sp. DSM 46786 TaxID=1798227 RepID=UPI0008BE21FF|nr:cysteine hydrolase family protein [Blastococcus sp. DSM 46786]SEM05850.1 Nicotinamidase-related amidase [Blastococcus sp. DSM 46786]
MSRALLVIDVQGEYDEGTLPVAWPPRTAALANVRRAVDAATARGIPVVVVQQTEKPGAPAFARGTAGWRLHPVLDGVRADLRVQKTLPSAFSGTSLDDWLRSEGVDTVTLVGFLTHNCIDSTARSAAHRGYAVEVLDDATGTIALRNAVGSVTAEELHRHTLLVLQSRFAGVLSTDGWVAALDGGSRPAPTGLLASAAAALEMVAP